MRSPPGAQFPDGTGADRSLGWVAGGGLRLRQGASPPAPPVLPTLLLWKMSTRSGEDGAVLERSCGFHLILRHGERRPLDTLEIFLRCRWGSCTLKPSFVGTYTPRNYFVAIILDWG